MTRTIDPTVDCVFKSILGSDHREGLLIHFLNAILGFEDKDRVVEVHLKNPFNPKETLDGKLSVVDIKATDQYGRTFQLEIQVANHMSLPERMLLNWASIYSDGISEGEDYQQLRPVIAIWLLAENLYNDVDEVHLPFGIYSPAIERYLSDGCRLHLVQLKKWPSDAKIENERDRWVSFFRHGKEIDLDNPPDWMKTKEMREAMSVMQTFTEKGENHDLYLSRLDAQREMLTWKAEIAAERQRAEHALAAEARERTEKERERAEKEREHAENERLRLLLKKAGIDPDSSDELG